MALNSGLFDTQDKNEQDLLGGPGWTIDDQHPGMFDNSALAIAGNVGSGLASVASTAAHALQDPDRLFSFINNPFGAAVSTVQGMREPYKAPEPGVLADIENSTRAAAKGMLPDPRVTGAGANVLGGFAKAVTEFTAGSLAGGPGLGATVLGVTEGNSRYHDLLDQGVDDQTAQKAALVEAIASGGGALLPMGLPAKWLGSGLSTAGTLITNAAAGAAINTTFNATARYASSKILEDAGYHAMAEQQKPFDAANLAADAITGLFFGAHHGWEGLGKLGADNVDPSVRDAAKTVQDRQFSAERAPGVPVDMEAAAVNRAALEKSLGDLLTGKRVEIDPNDVEGATFARAGEDPLTPEARQIIADHFKESGVLESADSFDSWLRGADEDVRQNAPESEVSPIDGREPDSDMATHPDADAMDNAARSFADDGSVVSEQTPGPLTDRPDLTIAGEDGEPVRADAAQSQAAAESAQANKEADTMFSAAADCAARRGDA